MTCNSTQISSLKSGIEKALGQLDTQIAAKAYSTHLPILGANLKAQADAGASNTHHL